jgi:3-hydroxyacyl-CoA dehydrogenase/enoyl-CoA hydratase/3-hydroxybutyryl-CoA epimerase
MPYLIGAVSLAEALHDPWRMDDAMTEFGMPMGPLRLLDEIGFDVALHVAATMKRAFPGRLPESHLLAKLAALGMLGRKNGEGFYLHDKTGAAPNPAILKHLRPSYVEPDSAAITARLASLMREEARLCVDEHVAASAADVELAMMLGSAFPPFRHLLDDPTVTPPR